MCGKLHVPFYEFVLFYIRFFFMFWFFLQFFTENCCFEFCIIFSGCRIDTSKCNIQIGVGEMLLRNKNSQQEMLGNLIKIWIEFTSWHFLCMRGNKLDCMWKNDCIFCVENHINSNFLSELLMKIFHWSVFLHLIVTYVELAWSATILTSESMQ